MDTKFSLAHIGSFLSERNPKILWESLLESIEEVQDYMEDIDKEYSSMYKMINYDPAVIHKQLYEILHDICYNISHGNFTDIRNYL